MRVALRLGYVGEAYHGYQRQPDRPTVEGEVIGALIDANLITDPSSSGFRSASRTDRGVSAVFQVVSFDALEPAVAICERVNSELPDDIFALGWTEVREGFDPRRSAVSKTYIYLLQEDIDPDSIRSRLVIFQGEHDFAQFSKPCGRRTVRSIEEVRFEPGKDRVFFTAKGFLWYQIRKIIAAVQSMQKGELDEKDVRRALRGEAELSIQPAPAEYLVLWRIEYGQVTIPVSRESERRAKEFLNRSMTSLERRAAVRRTLLSAFS
jgi:tRNA pseudouridine38-40 synthase